jgi:(1->4)-alpha-D-glucan 1-alpha-D-glucosylmutase
MSGRLRIPIATYRLQFNEGFRFKDAGALVSYLNRLGISDIYASPILKARHGSTHGYDVTDPTRLNPEFGSEKDFDALVKALQRRGMGLLLDIVPNHMAASPENPWWRDVLEHGKDSLFAGFFDTDWLNYKGSNGEATGYRRFFDIGDLAGVRVEDPPVFEATHAYILRLIAEGKVTGLRIDHIDGLYDPREYLRRLQQHISLSSKKGTGFYLVVEKILSGDETLPENWSVSGTTGYDFASMLNTLFVDRDGIEVLNNTYSHTTGVEKSFHDLVYEKKKQVMMELFPGEIAALGRWLAYLSGQLTVQEMSHALVEVTACLPVYRTYIDGMEVSPGDLLHIESAVKGAAERKACPEVSLSFLRRVLLLDFPADLDSGKKTGWLNFVRRWQQLTGAIMAKGFEDTALYNYNRLVSLNEVGSAPDATGLSIDDFHKWNLTRMKSQPYTLNATSTHDTKRSEDIRARINVLSEIPYEWDEHLMRWREWNEVKKRKLDGLSVPEPNTEVLLYQTLIGAWPLLPEEIPDFKQRLKVYLIKAVREAKAITSWLKINQEYEDSLLNFVDSILEDSSDNQFLNDFLRFQTKTAYYGALNSLSQLLLKIASPGVPDFYRGTELWDFSLVDPDNRRPVDFKQRERLLEALMREEPSAEEMFSFWRDGRVKLYVTYKALNFRRSNAPIFQKGDYIPLGVSGTRQEHVCAFARRYGERWALVAVPRFLAKITAVDTPPHVGKKVWQEDRLILPEDAPKHWHNVLTGELIESTGSLLLAGIFVTFPVALLVPLV